MYVIIKTPPTQECGLYASGKDLKKTPPNSTGDSGDGGAGG